MGVVYHVHFLDYFEYARTEALRQMGVAYRDIELSGVIMPVVDVAVQYKRPAMYDDLLEITTEFQDEIPKARVRIRYEVHRQPERQLVAVGSVTLCFLDAVKRRPVAAPARIVDAFERALILQ
jgi:acyl-CoA thioester hydrolase